MPDTPNMHIHVHKSWITGSKAYFLCRCRRWSYGGGRQQGTERVTEKERERGGWYQLYCGAYQHRRKLFCCFCLHASRTVSPPHSSRTRTHGTPASCPQLTSDTRPPSISASRCRDTPQPSITTDKRGKWTLNPIVTRLPGLQFSCL